MFCLVVVNQKFNLGTYEIYLIKMVGDVLRLWEVRIDIYVKRVEKDTNNGSWKATDRIGEKL